MSSGKDGSGLPMRQHKNNNSDKSYIITLLKIFDDTFRALVQHLSLHRTSNLIMFQTIQSSDGNHQRIFF